MSGELGMEVGIVEDRDLDGLWEMVEGVWRGSFRMEFEGNGGC